jgi:hypothetical protein
MGRGLSAPPNRLASIGALALFAALALLLYAPVGPFDAGRLAGGGFFDAGQMTWFLAWVPHAIAHGLNPFYSNYLDYPTGIDVANNPSEPLLGLLGAPVTAALGPVATLNFLLRCAFALSAFSMFAVLRAWSFHWTPSLLGGLLYGFGPYAIVQASANAHLDLVFVPLPPIIVFCVHDLVVAQRRRPRRIGLALGLCVGAQGLIDPEVLCLLGIVLAVGLVVLALVHPHEVMPRLRHLAPGALLSLAVFLVLDGDLLWWMLVAPGHLVGPVQQASFLQRYRGDLLGPVLPPSQQLISPGALSSIADRFDDGNLT